MIHVSDEVYVARGPVTTVTSRDIALLKAAAAANPRRRARLCAHPDVGDRLHEMLIVLARHAYVPPHKHPHRSESFHMIEGRLKIVLFDDDGRQLETIPMAEPGSGDVFFCRLPSSLYHLVVAETDFVTFHEVTNGPFDLKDTIVASWSPREDDIEGRARFLGGLGL